MNETTYDFTLWMVVAWPLLLAIPALYSRLPWPHHLAILPAMLLVAFAGDTSLEMPRILLGTGFSLDAEVRWILVMTAVIWLLAATVMQSWKHVTIINRATPFFLITLAGNLGVVLTSDLIGFFSFSALMGYGFYGLMLQRSNEEVQRVGRLYLGILVIADLILFEALLLAASTTNDLEFEPVQMAMTGTSSSQFYAWMVLIGFTLKAGIWPAHLWLSMTFRSASVLTTLLLGGVPVAMGLLGMIRWLPLGEHTFFTLGMAMQLMGMTAILYAVIRLLVHRSIKMLPAWVSIATTGLFIAALGTGLTNPSIWRQYEDFTYPFIAILGIFLTALTFTISRLGHSCKPPAHALPQSRILSLLTGEWINVIEKRIGDRYSGLLSRRISPLKEQILHLRISGWQKTFELTGGWGFRITMFVLIGLMLAWLAG